MAKKMLIDATHPEETRVVVVDGNKVEEFDFETLNKRQLAGNIYLAKVTRVEPSLQAAFVDYGGNRHGFLAFAEIHPDYYQIPMADRKALMEEERAMQRAAADEENGVRRQPRPRPQPARAETARSTDEVATADITSMDVVDLGEETGADALFDDAAKDRAETAAARTADDSADTGEVPETVEEPYRAMDHAADNDDEIESIAEEDLAEEIPEPRRPRHKKYKIQEVIKVRQIMLVQVVKEERGNKGAALTTYLSLAGRYCVLMPNTARGGGISRKITNAVDRKKLKEIAGEIIVPDGAGLIIRTAGAKRTKPEIKRDYEYLCRLWEQIRDLTFKSHAPAPIYEEGNLIKRTIRDLYSREIDEVLVEGAEGYRTARDFMRMIMPSQAHAVQHYTDSQPLFARFQVESYLAGMFNPVVQLKSGGYIVIGITEALVAIDVNSGRATKEGSIEDTALKTNLEACDEVARQLRLRDLAGLIVIDFIDMEERKNNAAVEKRLKDKLKTDRARIQVGRISGFGLMEMSRQRLRPGMLESTTQPCPHCHGTGLIRSDDSLALAILRALEEEGTRKRSKEVLLKAPVGIVNYLFNHKREHVAQIELRYGMSIRMEADPTLVSPDYVIEKFKTATRVVVPVSPVVSLDTSSMPDLDEDEAFEAEEAEATEDEEVPEAAPEAAEPAEVAASEPAEAKDGDGNGNGRKKRRRRRRRRGTGKDGANGGTEASGADEDEDDGEDGDEADDAVAEGAVVADAAPAPAVEVTEAPAPVEPAATAPAAAEAAPAKPARTRTRKKPAAAEAAPAEPVVAAEPAPEAEPAAKPARKRAGATSGRTRKPKATEAEVPVAEAAVPEASAAPAPDLTPASDPAPVAAAPAADWPQADAPVVETATAEPEAEGKPRRKGWWSLGR
ncbi:MAG: ribonuclease E/G [Gemmobacter sp.]|nr:ribonuclease E/G [Gemmobacter sp.]